MTWNAREVDTAGAANALIELAELITSGEAHAEH